jgi:predicted nuclease of predicted toxin-antitoxin system
MKLPLDENLSRRLVPKLLDVFPGTIHVADVDRLRTPDSEIWQYAKENGFTIITKDDDFLALAHRFGPPPKLIMVEMGNGSNAMLAERLRESAERLNEFVTHTRAGIIKLI